MKLDSDLLTLTDDLLSIDFFDIISDPQEKKKKKMSAGLRTKVFENDKYRCVHCGTHKDLCVDHIKPESSGGTFDLDNLQTLCKTCNSRKGVKEE